MTDITAFQDSAFQNDAFQIGDGVIVPNQGGGSYSWAPTQATVDKIWNLLYGKKKKRFRKAARLEKAALAVMREFEPGPNLPPLDLSALKAAIAMLDKPVQARHENRRIVVEQLFDMAAELQRQNEIDDEDAIIIAMILH